ncbi:hypothetical protein ACWGB8_07575 [Kitasatospora sp. NPDC054939]
MLALLDERPLLAGLSREALLLRVTLLLGLLPVLLRSLRELLLAVLLGLALLPVPLLSVPVALRELPLLAGEPLLLVVALLLAVLLGLALLPVPLLVGLLSVPVTLRELSLLELLLLVLPLAVLLAGDRLLPAVPGITGVPRFGALGAVAPTQIGH